MTNLPDAPLQPWDDDGAVCFGTYRGELAVYPIDDRFGRFERARAQKRWLWCGVMNTEIAVALAIVRTGYAANVFCWVYDRGRGEFLQDVSRVLPRPAVSVAGTPAGGVIAAYQGLVEKIDVRRHEKVWRIDGRVGDASIDLELVEATVPVTAICPSAAGAEALNVTTKRTMVASGSIRVGTHRVDVRDAIGMIDHTHGMLSRETVWQWAIGSGRFTDDDSPVSFNLVASFNDGLENTIWLDGEPTHAGFATFDIPEEHGSPWRVTSDRVDLVMGPDAFRAQELDLGLIESDYLQPLGTWRGTIDGRAIIADGVGELHRSVW